MRPSFCKGPAICASLGEKGFPSIDPVAPGAGWVGAGAAVASDDGAAFEPVLVASLVGDSAEAGAGDAAFVSPAEDELDSSDEVSTVSAGF
jgi:hypothetical protein